MAETHARLGTDLRLLRDVESQQSRLRGEDLEVAQRSATRGGAQVDLALLSAVDNLRQALLLRFLTPQGELAQLGHPEYGSRLHTLLGEPNVETTRNRAKLFTLQALQAEPRVEEVVAVEVTSRRTQPTRIDIHVRVKVIEGGGELNLVFPFFLDGGTAP